MLEDYGCEVDGVTLELELIPWVYSQPKNTKQFGVRAENRGSWAE